MKPTGIIRRLDDLGRIILPKEIRRKVGIREGTPMEIFVTTDGVLLKKYYPESELYDVVRNLSDAVDDACVDLGEEMTVNIRKHIREIQMLLKPQN
ncbi:AbrB/MazE/SpoVT family DNA-binding domain-containing protein [Lacrimispora sp. HJ1]|uniref:AbrB/MazE/SpoVT family DNA-binding domain-containing protein n=1 Tax=Lacrimispora sp. HJ1 TaxID=3243293 RepID=UPI00377061E5